MKIIKIKVKFREMHKFLAIFQFAKGHQTNFGRVMVRSGDRSMAAHADAWESARGKTRCVRLTRGVSSSPGLLSSALSSSIKTPSKTKLTTKAAAATTTVARSSLSSDDSESDDIARAWCCGRSQYCVSRDYGRLCAVDAE